MNLQQAAQPRNSVNGFGRRRVEKETGTRLENKMQTGKSNSSWLTSAGVPIDNKGGGENPSRERLVYLTTCLIGHQVDVQVIDGSVFSGILHATNADKDFGVILKMARLTKTSSSQGKKSFLDSANKPPSKTFIIPAKELVQITAKSVSITRDGLTNEIQREKQQEILIDSSISQSRHIDLERELERWVPDEDTPECPELDNIFDGQWNRGWDQFEANEALFGVKSTFNEDLYTTKLDRGPQMRELEREAFRIAREIEGEDTKDLHLAEERGISFHDKFDIDEETRYSSVFRGVDDSGFEENEDMLDSNNMETFGDVYDSKMCMPFTDLTCGKVNNDSQLSSSFPSLDEVQYFKLIGKDKFQSVSNDHVARSISDLDDEIRIQENFNEQNAGIAHTKEERQKHTLAQGAHTSKIEDSQSSQRLKKENFDKAVLSPDATAYAPSRGSSKGQEKTTTSSSNDFSETAASVKAHGATQASAVSRARPGSSASSASDCGNAVPISSGPGLSPSSSIGSLSSEKSGLNPHAKEFRLNPNAKSYVPSQAPLRPASPASDGSFYFPANVAPVPHMHGMPVGMGIGPSFAPHQPVIFGPQAASLQSPQAYYHPNGPQYGQQMMLAQPRQVLYMPTYPPEMQYKGRDY